MGLRLIRAILISIIIYLIYVIIYQTPDPDYHPPAEAMDSPSLGALPANDILPKRLEKWRENLYPVSDHGNGIIYQ